MRIETIGRATLYLGDCREIMPMIDRPDAIFTDPPYGQKLNTNITGGKSALLRRPLPDGQRQTAAGKLRTPPKQARVFPQGIVGDGKPFDPAHLITASDKWLIWGAHKFGHMLPKARELVWDKVPTGKIRDQGDGESARCNVNPDGAMRIYRLLWDGVCVGSAAKHEVGPGQQREHPTQKPESLMSWCLGFLELQPDSLICDPYMGAGSAGMAAVKAGHRFVGIEIEPIYFDAACRRIEQAQRQADLFI